MEFICRDKILIIMITALICLSLASFNAKADPNPNPEQGQESARSRYKLPKLFDFNRFKEIFNKCYGAIENLARQRLFLGRAVRAFVTAIQYKHRRLSYYLSINYMSDWTPEELSRGAMTQSDVDELQKRVEPLPVADLYKIEEELKEAIERSNEPGYREVSNELLASDKHDHTSETSSEKDRDVSVYDLVDKNELVDDSAMIAEVTTNSKSLSEDEADKITCAVAFDFLGFTIKETAQMIGSALAKPFKKGIEKMQRDEVFIDHRDSGCIPLPKSQGTCGSCYIFAAMTLYEYFYCMATKKQVTFSEQYVVDCGYHAKIYGCSGGQFISVSEFVNRYGLELRDHYRYRGRDDTCPYPDDTPPSAMGYIRTFDKGFRHFKLHQIKNYLKMGPMIMNFRHTNELYEYGGGVHDGGGCWAGSKIHSMVLIGHGREDNQEYWLFRNSHSFIWGESGHYKMSKRANCFEPQYAYTLYGFQILESEKNKEYAGTKLLEKRMREYERNTN